MTAKKIKTDPRDPYVRSPAADEADFRTHLNKIAEVKPEVKAEVKTEVKTEDERESEVKSEVKEEPQDK